MYEEQDDETEAELSEESIVISTCSKAILLGKIQLLS
jgi:hypothetical protein